MTEDELQAQLEAAQTLIAGLLNEVFSLRLQVAVCECEEEVEEEEEFFV